MERERERRGKARSLALFASSLPKSAFSSFFFLSFVPARLCMPFPGAVDDDDARVNNHSQRGAVKQAAEPGERTANSLSASPTSRVSVHAARNRPSVSARWTLAERELFT